MRKLYFKSKDAFGQYDEILAAARACDKTALLCFILGPTTKPLVAQLASEGYMAWDIGHLAKDYDAYRKGRAKDRKSAAQFFKPD